MTARKTRSATSADTSRDSKVRKEAREVLMIWSGVLHEHERLIELRRSGSQAEQRRAGRNLGLLYGLLSRARGRPTPSALKKWLAPPKRPKDVIDWRISLAHRYVRQLILLARDFDEQFGGWSSIQELDDHAAIMAVAVTVGAKRADHLEHTIRSVLATPRADESGSWHDAIAVMEALGNFGSASTIVRSLRAHKARGMDRGGESSASATTSDTGNAAEGSPASARKAGAVHDSSEVAHGHRGRGNRPRTT